MEQQKHAASRRENHQALAEFEGGDGAQDFDLAASSSKVESGPKLRICLHLEVGGGMPFTAYSIGRDVHVGIGLGLPCAYAGSQLLHNFLGGLAGGGLLADVEGNGTHTGVSAAAVTLTDLGQIHHAGRVRPGV